MMMMMMMMMMTMMMMMMMMMNHETHGLIYPVDPLRLPPQAVSTPPQGQALGITMALRL